MTTLPDITSPLRRRRLWLTWRQHLERWRWRSTPWGPRRRDRDLILPAKAFGGVMAALGLYGRGLRNTLKVAVREVALHCPDLPAAFDGYRLLHLTDLHLDLCPGLEEAITEAVAACPADACVMTGDYRAATHGPHHPALAALGRLLRAVQAPDGIFATLGNHDCAAMAAPMEDMGIAVLANDAVWLRRDGARLRLVGLDDVHTFYTPLATAALEDHAPSADGVFSLALVHSPDMAGAAAALGFGAYLCGHTHGGQICLPGGRPLVTHLDAHHDLVRGEWRVGGMAGYTSCGAGASAVPLRYFTRSEVTRITLRRKA